MHRPFIFSGSRFARDESGNVAIVFGLTATVILLALGIGLDVARTMNMNTRLATAADAATLAAGRAMLEGKMSDEEVIDLAKGFLHTNAKSSGRGMFGSYSEPVVTLDRDAGTVKIDLDVSVPTTASRISGIERLDVPVDSAGVFGQSDVEVAMALDVTGSMMDYGPDGKRKIDSLKKAFRAFIAELLPEHMPDGRKVRVAVAPYSSGVNLGNYAKRASNNRSRDGCVIERTGGAAGTDAPLSAAAYFKVHEDQPRDIDGTEGIQSYTCPNAGIIPLTDDADTLTRAVDNYRASGSTSGHMGLQWAWNLISPDWGSFWGGNAMPDPYSRTKPQGEKRPELIKAIILMSDGIFNTSFHNGNSANQANTLCSNIKDASAKNVLVFAVAFGNPPAQAKRTLEQCASPGPEYYADATNEVQLQAALSQFANVLNRLRLTQ